MNSNTTNELGFVLVHGAGLGSWIWEDVMHLLDLPYLNIDLPKRGETTEARAGLSLEDYVQDTLLQINQWSVRNIVVVAHSLGGVIGLEVATRLNERLAGFVGVSAAIPKSGGSFLSALPFPKNLIMSVILRTSGTKPPAGAIKAGLCNDLDEKKMNKVTDKYCPESLRLYTDKANYDLRNTPSLYIRSTNDKEFGGKLQAHMANRLPSVAIQDIDSGHLPMLSKPKVLATILNDFAGGLK